MDLNWHSIEDIGVLLLENYPETDPLSVRFTDLHKMVTGLSGFYDDPKKSNEAILEAIQMAWYEEYKDAQDE
ncbi:MAG: Fe-S cluster assembly protein IscX [Nitrospiria bacterium]